MKEILILAGVLLWMYLVGCIGARECERGYGKLNNIFHAIVWTLWITFLTPIAFTCDIIKHGWKNDR